MQHNNTALRSVARSATVTCVQLLKAGADVSKYDSVVILNAAKAGCSERLKLLIEAGAHVNATGPFGTTALNEVVSIHNWPDENGKCFQDVKIFNCVQVLLKLGANVTNLTGLLLMLQSYT